MPIKPPEQQDDANLDGIQLGQTLPMQSLRDSKDFFFLYMQRQFPDLELFRKNIYPALCTILAAYEPPLVEFIQHLFNWQAEELRDFIRPVGSLFPVTDESGHNVIKPYIPSLSGWLTDESQAGPYFVCIAEGHRTLADLGWRDYQHDVQSLSSYFLRYLPQHLFQEGRKDDAILLLDNEEFHARRREIPNQIRIEEAKLRFPSVAEFLRYRENDYQSALTLGDPEDCSLTVSARDLNETEASRLYAKETFLAGEDVYNHVEYTIYAVVTFDGQRHEGYVSREKSLAEVLPTFRSPPVMVLQTHHASGPTGPGCLWFHEEEVVLLRVPPSMRNALGSPE